MKTIISTGGVVTASEHTPLELAELASFAPQPPTLEEQRATWFCSPAQMRLALLGLGLLATVQQIADSDPQASIVWEFATQIIRNSPFIAQLANNGVQAFTPEEIDGIFQVAMAVAV